MPTAQPKPLFDNAKRSMDEPPRCVYDYLNSIELPNIIEDFQITLDFLRSYNGSEDTYNAYRREVERLLHWSWQIERSPLANLDRNAIQRYIEFANSPPLNWIGTKNARRFTLDGEQQRVSNSEWRPFTIRVSKAAHKTGHHADPKQHALSTQSQRALFAGLSTFFTYLVQEEYCLSNPVQLIRQKKRYLQTQQTTRVTRKLSHTQWQYVIDTVKQLAASDPSYHRHLFLISAFYLLGLRISEVSVTPGRIPTMGDFAPDQQGDWWFSTVSKGNKFREIAVPDSMLIALRDYRSHLGLTPLPTRGESTPLIAKLRGKDGLGVRQVRNLIQACFDHAINKLRSDGHSEAADDLETATVHWLRHTAISADVAHRPREHVRDDVGHENIAVTDRYIDTDRQARHQSAKHKPLNPEETIVDG